MSYLDNETIIELREGFNIKAHKILFTNVNEMLNMYGALIANLDMFTDDILTEEYIVENLPMTICTFITEGGEADIARFFGFSMEIAEEDGKFSVVSTDGDKLAFTEMHDGDITSLWTGVYKLNKRPFVSRFRLLKAGELLTLEKKHERIAGMQEMQKKLIEIQKLEDSQSFKEPEWTPSEEDLPPNTH